MRRSLGLARVVVGVFVAGWSSGTAWADDAQGSPTAQDGNQATPDAQATDGQQAGQETSNETTESDFSQTQTRRIAQRWNRYDFGFLTLKWGIYSLIDFGNAVQSDESKALIEVPRDWKIRDFRFSISGKFATERKITYTSGIMYDGPSNSIFIRETGIQVSFPELWGDVFIGRQKEGISLSKITVGYAPPPMERMPISDAAIPILADGIKWLGGLPNHHANWNIAYYRNELPKSPSTDWYDQAFVARLAVLPLRPGPDDDDRGSLLHLAAAYHWGEFSNGETQLDSRPGSSTAPVFLDTGIFPAATNHMVGLEAYYRWNNWMLGSEYLLDFIKSQPVGNPLLHGGEVWLSWLATGEIRPYIDVGGKMGFVKPKASAFDDGPGAWETVLHVSYTDLDDEGVRGGKFWRITPQVNWYLDSMFAIRLCYGLGHLEREAGEGYTHFFQARFQYQIQ